MVVSVIIDDYVRDVRESLVFTEKQMQVVRDNWENQDKLLVEMSVTDFFKDRTRWCDLQPIHYKVMIMRNFMIVTNLDVTAAKITPEEAEQSLHFLIAALINCIETISGSKIGIFRIQRINDGVINFDYQASLLLELEKAKSAAKAAADVKRNPFKIVVDNTKDET